MAAQDPSIYGQPAAPQQQLPQLGAATTSFYPAGSTATGFPTTATSGQPYTSNGYGTPPGSATAQSFTPTLQPGQGSPADVGYNGNVPGMGENVSKAFLDHYGAEGAPSNTNYASQAYGAAQQQAPADMSAYYDNAERKSTQAIDKAMAARGSYGSSNAVGQIASASTDLRAQEARDNAQYGLSRAQTMGGLASSADSSGRANSADERDWMSGLTKLGFDNQREGTARYQLGNENALTAANTASGVLGSTYGAEMDADHDLLVQTLMAQGMTASDAATAAANSANQERTDNNATTQSMVQGASSLAQFV